MPARTSTRTTAAWTPGDPPGRRQFAQLGTLALESGAKLPEVQIAYETWGTLNRTRTNAVLVLHALTGDSHVCGDAGPGHPSPGWWNDLVGPGRAIDTDEYFVVAPNSLGGCQGSTGPASPEPDGRRAWGSRFPRITIRDQVAAELAFADAIGIERWRAVVGGSMGAMRALEWAIMAPDRVRALGFVAAGATTTAEQIAFNAVQLQAIWNDPNWHGGDYYDKDAGPAAGLGNARRLAHITYRSEWELATRFGRSPQGDEDPLAGGRFGVESYLDHHAAKLVSRFDAGSYVHLVQAMNSYDVGRGRGGVPAALARVTARTLVVGVDSDRLYPLAQQMEIAEGVPTADRLRVINSPFGHDGFLIESDQLAPLIADLLSDSGRRQA